MRLVHAGPLLVDSTSALFSPLEEGMPVDVFQHYLAPAQTATPKEVRGQGTGGKAGMAGII